MSARTFADARAAELAAAERAIHTALRHIELAARFAYSDELDHARAATIDAGAAISAALTDADEASREDYGAHLVEMSVWASGR